MLMDLIFIWLNVIPLVSATLLDMNNDGTFFLDIGEGTYGQMFRQFGGYERSADQKDSVDARIRRLKGIFISHLHADHHLGTVTVIDRWNKVLLDPWAVLVGSVIYCGCS